MNFTSLASLQILHLRGNRIENLDGFESLKELRYLNLRGNLVPNMQQVEKLASLTNLQTLVLSENPVSESENYRLIVLTKLTKLERIDKDPILQEERDDAAALIV